VVQDAKSVSCENLVLSVRGARMLCAGLYPCAPRHGSLAEARVGVFARLETEGNDG